MAVADWSLRDRDEQASGAFDFVSDDFAGVDVCSFDGHWISAGCDRAGLCGHFAEPAGGGSGGAGLMLTDIVVEATVVALLLAITVQIKKRIGTVDPNHVDMLKG